MNQGKSGEREDSELYFLPYQDNTPERFENRPAKHVFTYRYSQPQAYHFCLDSIILAYFVSTQIRPNVACPNKFRALDLCAGCGVVGLELAFYHPWMRHFDFSEIQSEVFAPHFEKNREISGHAGHAFNFIPGDFRQLSTPLLAQSYNLIVANPPYFFKGEGLNPPSDIKHRARFFVDATFVDMIQSIVFLLRPGARAYFLARLGHEHGRPLIEELKPLLGSHAELRLAAWARSTAIFEILKTQS